MGGGGESLQEMTDNQSIEIIHLHLDEFSPYLDERKELVWAGIRHTQVSSPLNAFTESSCYRLVSTSWKRAVDTCYFQAMGTGACFFFFTPC